MKCVVDENLYQIVLRSVSNGAFGIPEQHHAHCIEKERNVMKIGNAEEEFAKLGNSKS